MQIDPTHSIGVFDSGLGGLTVVRALNQSLPQENIIYFGDTARVPYGVKSAETIVRYAEQITRFMLQYPVKLLVIACNSMSAVAYEAVCALSPVPVLEVIDAGARCAAEATRKHRVGIIGTPATIRSNAYQHQVQRLDDRIQTLPQACALFVPLVEEGWLDHPVTRLTAQEYLGPLLAQDIDTLVLGCTHYPLLKPLLQQIAGPGVRLIDSAEAVAALARETLSRNSMLNPRETPAKQVFFVTDAPEHFRQMGQRFLGAPMTDVRLVQW